MRQDSSAIGWKQEDEEWIALAQSNDFRMFFIMPYTLEYLGDVRGMDILDLGCGEGGYSRELAAAGARVYSVDSSSFFIEYAAEKALEECLDIRHFVRNSDDLYGIPEESFDRVLCSMMLMDCEDLQGTLREIMRVLKPGGKLVASVLHPCFYGKEITWSGDDTEKKVTVEDYFHPVLWERALYKDVDKPIIWRHRTLQDYVKAFVACGFSVTDLTEPITTQNQIKKFPGLGWLQKIPLFLFWELEKKRGGNGEG